ncbi:ABC transporter substrate-binding protein [Saccharothrix saharensis]|uniref:ABC transporter substrate-binding protein n=1 Tax=Saccharothrix saharensis TaxID=571190 RepID=UPI00367C9254
MDRLVSLLDDVTGSRPKLPSLVVVATSTDPARNTEFLDALTARLSGKGHSALVPHAYADKDLVESAAERELLPYAALLDEILQRLRHRIPRGAGGNWKAKRCRLVLDVLDTDGKIGAARQDTRRSMLLTLLYEQWASRNPLVGWLRKMNQNDLPVPLIGTLLSAILSGPLKWAHSRRLNSRATRWFGDAVRSRVGEPGDFASHALWLLASGGLDADRRDNLHRQVLVKAMLMDLSDLMRPGRISPRRRRRRWTPVLLLDGAQPRVAALLDEFGAQMEHLDPAPLLVVGALDPQHAEQVATVAHTVPDAATAVNRFVEGERSVLAKAPYLAVRLPVAGERAAEHNPAVRTWIDSHPHVAPRVPGLSAVAPLAVVVALLAGASGFGAYQYLLGGCSDTKINLSGERVGVIESGCSFVSGKAVDNPRVPALATLEQQAAENNKAVDRLKDRQGNPRYYRTVIFFGPLTRADQAESTAPPNAIWQLQGVVSKQKEHNQLADSDDGKVPVKLVLANSGDRFADGTWVAQRIAERKRAGRGELAAVIGISQSRPQALEAVGSLSGIPVIGAAMYGSGMTANPNMFLSSPFNAAFAEEIAKWVRAQPGVQGAAVVHDPDDTYFSKELQADLRHRNVGSDDKDVIAREVPSRNGIAEPTLKREDVERLCAEADTVVPVIASRGDQLLKLLSIGADVKACKDRLDQPIRIISGPGGIVVVGSGVLADYPWVKVWVTGLAGTAERSEWVAGANSFGMAAQAIADAHHDTTQVPVWDVSQVLACLRDPEFDYDGLKPNVPGVGDGRVHIIEPAVG